MTKSQENRSFFPVRLSPSSCGGKEWGGGEKVYVAGAAKGTGGPLEILPYSIAVSKTRIGPDRVTVLNTVFP